MSDQKDKALELGRVKSVREQTKIRVYEDNSTEKDDYLVSPKDLSGRSDLTLIDSFETSIDEDESEDDIVEVEDHSEIEEGDQVIINDEENDQVIRVTDRQITTLSGDKYRRSDGKLWGNNENDRAITHKVLI